MDRQTERRHAIAIPHFALKCIAPGKNCVIQLINLTYYCGGEKILSPPRFLHCGGEFPRCPRGSDAFATYTRVYDTLVCDMRDGLAYVRSYSITQNTNQQTDCWTRTALISVLCVLYFAILHWSEVQHSTQEETHHFVGRQFQSSWLTRVIVIRRKWPHKDRQTDRQTMTCHQHTLCPKKNMWLHFLQ